MASELTCNIQLDGLVSVFGPFYKILGFQSAIDVGGSLRGGGAFTATTTPASLSVPSGMSSNRGVLAIANVQKTLNINVGVLAAAAFRLFGACPTSGFPCVIYTSASADIQVSTDTSTQIGVYAWLQR